jgi:hypothetical protein
MAKLGFPRASEGQDARSERPARWHGPTPSPREVNPTRASGEMARAHPEPAQGEPDPHGVAAVSGNRSWIGWTESGSLRIPSMARTQASAAGSVVMQGTP